MNSKKTPVISEYNKTVHGACYMCDSYCPTMVYIKDGKAIGVEMLDDKIHDLCPRWRAQLDFVYHKNRLQHPLKRTGERGVGNFKKISWDEALGSIADKLLELKDNLGPESVAWYIAYTKEPRPYFRRLVHGYGSPNYTTETSSCFSAGWLAATLNFGKEYGYLLGNSRSIDQEGKTMMVWSSGVRESSPHYWNDYLEAKKRGFNFIVVDPRRTRFAQLADLYLQLRPGTDGALAHGMLNIIINNKLYDSDFVSKWTIGFNELVEYVQDFPPEKVSRITRVPEDLIIDAAFLFAKNKPSKIRTSPGATIHHQNGVQNTRAILLISALTGNLEVPGGNRVSTLAAPSNNITLKERVARMPPGIGSQRFPVFTNLFEEMQANSIVDQIISSDPYPIKALFAAGLNLQFFANYSRLTNTLKKLDLIVNIDYFQTPGTMISDFVLPISTWLERDILIMKPGGLTRWVKPAIEPLGQTWPEWKIYAELAKKLGIGELFYDGDISKCFQYILEPTGIKLEELSAKPEGIVYNVERTKVKQYEETGFSTPSGKVEIWSSILEKYGYDPLPTYKEPIESPLSTPDLASRYPLVLTTGVRTISYTHSQHRNIAKLRSMVPDPLLEIHPDDASIRGINSGDDVMVFSPRGEVIVKAHVTDIILQGVVHLPHHWPFEANANILSDDINLDPISGFPGFKSQLCQVRIY